MSAAQIKDTLKACIESAVERRELAGCTFCLIRDGREELYLETGYANIEEKQPIRRDSIYRMYSMSKPVTAAAVMKLAEDGRLDLQDPVSRFLPSFANQSYEDEDKTLRPVARENTMTVRHLMNMTSGLCYPNLFSKAGQATTAVYAEQIQRLDTENQMTTREFAERIGECPLLFRPGKGWNYGVSADILGAVVEIVTGMSFGEYLREAILDPTGMEDTDFYVPDEKKDRLVTAYMNRGDKAGAELEPYTGSNLGIRNNGGRNAFESGGAGLFSTLDDYCRFTGMLMNGGIAENGKQILRQGTVRYLTGGKLSGEQQMWFDRWNGLEGHSYGNLNRVMVDPQCAATIGHKGEYGWDGWLGAYFSNDPQAHQTILLMLNQKDYGTGRLTREIRNIVNSDTF
jgi:CubicO group peptidase (beta-lactamase class C family)